MYRFILDYFDSLYFIPLKQVTNIIYIFDEAAKIFLYLYTEGLIRQYHYLR